MSVEDSIIATQRSIITIQDELNATNDSIIELLKIDNARLEEKIVHLQHQLSYITNKLSQVQDLLCSAEGAVV
jgi:predicted nuclease with TOPRIM domain